MAAAAVAVDAHSHPLSPSRGPLSLPSTTALATPSLTPMGLPLALATAPTASTDGRARRWVAPGSRPAGSPSSGPASAHLSGSPDRNRLQTSPPNLFHPPSTRHQSSAVGIASPDATHPTPTHLGTRPRRSEPPPGRPPDPPVRPTPLTASRDSSHPHLTLTSSAPIPSMPPPPNGPPATAGSGLTADLGSPSGRPPDDTGPPPPAAASHTFQPLPPTSLPSAAAYRSPPSTAGLSAAACSVAAAALGSPSGRPPDGTGPSPPGAASHTFQPLPPTSLPSAVAYRSTPSTAGLSAAACSVAAAEPGPPSGRPPGVVTTAPSDTASSVPQLLPAASLPPTPAYQALPSSSAPPATAGGARATVVGTSSGLRPGDTVATPQATSPPGATAAATPPDGHPAATRATVAAPDSVDGQPDAQWEQGLLDPRVAAGLQRLRTLLDKADTVPFRAGQLVEARLRDVLGQDLPASFRIPVEVADLTPDLGEWMRSQQFLLPHMDSVRPPSPRSARELSLAIDCGAVEVVFQSYVTAYAPVFTVEQHGGKIRLIFDLRALNNTLDSATFSDNGVDIETVYDVPSFLEAWNVAVASKIDLKSAFWQVPLADSLARLMGVRLQGGRVGRWQALPFGLSHAPRLFQTLTNAFVRRWRRMGIAVLGYLDDLLIGGTNELEHARNVTAVVSDLRAAGIRLSSKKAYLAPYKKIEFLGILFDIPNRSIAVSDSRLARVADDAADLATNDSATVRDILAILGRIQFIAFAHPLVTFHRSALLRCVRGLSPADTTQLDADARADLEWWTHHARGVLSDRWTPWRSPSAVRVRASYAGRRGVESTPTLVPDLIASTDASDTGVGFRHALGRLQAEPLPDHLRNAPSAARELFGVLRVVETARLPRGGVIRVLCDNSSVQSSVHGRSVSTAVAAVGKRLMAECYRRGLFVDVEWLPRDMLASEDGASRYTDGSLAFGRPQAHWLAHTFNQVWGTDAAPGLELFACEADRATSAPFLSRLPMPGSVGEALSYDWSTVQRGWAYPPFGLVRPVLSRLVTTLHQPPDIIWLLPDTQLVRDRLGSAYHFLPGPTELIAPGGSLVTLTSPLVVCVPDTTTTGRPMPPGAPDTEHLNHPPATAATSGHTVARDTPTAAGPTATPDTVTSSAAPPTFIFREVPGDLFHGDPTDHAMHCISAHAELSAGIAKGVAALCDGDMPSIRTAARRLYNPDNRSFVPGVVFSPLAGSLRWAHLVTKAKGSDVPTLSSIEAALRSAFAALSTSPCPRVRMPRIASGIDRQVWADVRTVIRRVLHETPRPDGVPWQVTVYY